MASSNNIFSVNNIDIKTTEEIKGCFQGFGNFNNFVRIGPKGYFFPEYPDLDEQICSVYNANFRKSDVIVVTFPRSGTTWTQELVWLVVNHLNYEFTKSQNIFQRYTYLDYGRRHSEETLHKHTRENGTDTSGVLKMVHAKWGTKALDSMPDPRLIKTHIPLSLLPPNIEDTVNVVYVARDPRDVAVSYYHLHKIMPRYSFTGNFKTFWNLFVRDLTLRSPVFEHVKEAWERRNHPNFLFLFYEELSDNIRKTIQKVCDFLGKQYTEEEIDKLCEHLKHENFKKNPSTNLSFLKDIDYFIKIEGADFIGKGKAGGWRDYFDDEMTKQAEVWIENNLRDTDLRFPQYITKED